MSTPPQKDGERVELKLSVEARDHLREILHGDLLEFDPFTCPKCQEIAVALPRHTTSEGGSSE